MTFYSSPNIPTRDNIEGNLPQLLPDPEAESLQRGLHQFVEVPTAPTFERVYPIIVPDVPYSYGWHAQQIDWPIDRIANPGSAPDIMLNTGSYSTQIQKAGTLQPQTSAMGVYGALRAPGINEGQ